jgi:uncharacterized protein DUF2252
MGRHRCVLHAFALDKGWPLYPKQLKRLEMRPMHGVFTHRRDMKKKQRSNGRANGSSFASEEVSFQRATASYEGWMRNCTAVVSSDLRLKHEQMKESSFLFLRGTFYRWAQMWPSICAGLCGAPKVLAVGDLHVNSFGTWRDAEGRLCWGVDDFDESYPLAYTNDLVRLAASLKIVIDAETLSTRFEDGITVRPSWV